MHSTDTQSISLDYSMGPSATKEFIFMHIFEVKNFEKFSEKIALYN